MSAAERPPSAQPAAAAAPSVSFVLDTASGGDAADRPTTRVAVPRSLPELKQAAGLHFDPKGRSVRMRLFHRGKEMHHPLAVEQLKDGDVVTVRLERPMQRVADAVLTTTHQADFIRHPLQSRPPRDVEERGAVASVLQGKLEGRSSYASDYVRHPAVERPPHASQAKYSKHWLCTPRGTERAESTYRQYFPWHTAQPDKGVNSAEGSSLSEATRGMPFSARTSYRDDYTKKQVVAVTRPCQSDHESTLSAQAKRAPFDGASQYAADFVKHDHDCRQPSARPDRGTYCYTPFSGASEYRQQFRAESTQAPLIHLKCDA